METLEASGGAGTRRAAKDTRASICDAGKESRLQRPHRRLPRHKKSRVSNTSEWFARARNEPRGSAGRDYVQRKKTASIKCGFSHTARWKLVPGQSNTHVLGLCFSLRQAAEGP